MRIIAGKHRGLVLASFAGTDIRPTPDRVKESLFQILSDRLTGARVLDLFSGSGALGIECLSRGAAEAVFNDSSKESIALIGKNLCAAHETGRVLRRDYAACLAEVGGMFDLILCDPPYREDFAGRVLSLIGQYSRLKEDGLVVYESERDILPPPDWELSDKRSYGRVKIFFFKRRKH